MGPREQGKPLAPGPALAGTFYASGELASSPYTYGRYHNPTWTRFEEALGELEGGIALAFASGMAAIAGVFSATLRAGDTVVVPADCYYTSRLLLDEVFGHMGLEVKKVATADNSQLGVFKGAKLVFVETPANPSLDVCDIQAMANAAHEAGALVAVDNTTASVLGQRPLELGADFSISSDTKAITGHADIILGHVAVRDEAWAEKLHHIRNLTGGVPGPMEVWLAHRSLLTLEMRLQRQCSNAQAVAEYLLTRSDVTGVRYPGLPTDPSHLVASRQMAFFGSVIAFILPDKERADKFLRACQLVIEATSFGGLHTTAERRRRWGGDDISEGFIRVSVGCEDVRDIIEDLARGLAASQ